MTTTTSAEDLSVDARATIDRGHRERATTAQIPGMAWGAVLHGELVHTGSLGTTDVEAPGGGARPGPHTRFRIASMTKSFTAAAVLSLRDHGALRLDEPVATYVPELTGLRGPTADSPAVTVRHLLSMDAGLATDDPWADRHLDIGADELSELYRTGAWFAVTPGTGFVYSNLGYSMLGRVVANVTGDSCQAAIRARLLAPLGMHDTGWELRPTDTDVAHGHRLVDGVAVREAPPLGDGGIAPMGGLWSTVADLARWVAFFLDAFPPRDGADDLPLRRATRRDMQRVWRPTRVQVEQLALHGGLRTSAVGYGFGLQVGEDLLAGFTAGHAGGLPGYGSFMSWLPDRGFGLIALGNVTYAPAALAIRAAIEELARRDQLPPKRPLPIASPLQRAADDLVVLINEWSDERALALFADNVAMDEPLDRRAAEARAAVELLGPLTVESVRVNNRADADLVLRGPHGTALVELSLHPEDPPRVQTVDITVVPTPSPELIAANAALCALARAEVTAAELVGLVDDGVAATVAATLAHVAGRLGRCTPGERRGDHGRTTFQWRGEHGTIDVNLGGHTDDGRIGSVSFTLPTRGGV